MNKRVSGIGNLICSMLITLFGFKCDFLYKPRVESKIISSIEAALMKKNVIKKLKYVMHPPGKCMDRR